MDILKNSGNHKAGDTRKGLSSYFQKWQKIRYRIMSAESIFTEIYRKNSWGGISKSGSGSDLSQTQTIREKLPQLVKDLEISSLLDIPCGDFYWLKEVNLDFLSYVGADIVDDIIRHNQEKFHKQNRTFIKLDIPNDDLPKVDLIFCRDLFVHFSFNDISKSIRNIKRSGSKYLLTTSFTETKVNVDIVTGEWRKLNLQMLPFSFSDPLKIIIEKSSEDRAFDKSLSLWKISDLQIH